LTCHPSGERTNESVRRKVLTDAAVSYFERSPAKCFVFLIFGLDHAMAKPFLKRAQFPLEDRKKKVNKKKPIFQ